MQQEIWFQKYQILGLLGKGGNAKVYLAKHIKLNSFRAIKFISKNHPLYDLQRKEALLLKNLKHSCIPIIYDIEEDEYGSYIIEQYLEGETLKSAVSKQGPFQEDFIIQLGLQLCDLFQYLHSIERPILYVDLKPENIILYNKCLKLIDFGSAVYLDEAAKQPGYLGTKGYAAPELYSRSRIDERCDIYGIGILLYYMVTGQSFMHNNGQQSHIDYSGQCSKQLKKVINQCLKYHPSQRFSSVAKLSKQLSIMLQDSSHGSESSRFVTIAIAGSQSRIGVTHLAFRICKYLIDQRQRCLYQEQNESGCVWSIRNCYEEIEVKNGLYLVEGIPLLAKQHNCMPCLEQYNKIVRDYGCLTQNNLEDFLTADVRLLIVGAKDWELENTEQVINMTAEYKDISYLFNYLNGRQYQSILQGMDGKSSFRIPYEPDPFAKITSQNGLEFFRDIIRF